MKTSFAKKDLPLVSIITPSYNQAQFIEETLLSVRVQDYPNIEHIVIDGASSDNTVDILRKNENYYNLRWISEPDNGHADAVNKGFEMANGNIIGWLNSDDVYFDRSTVSAVVEAFRKYQEAHVIYGDVAYIWEDGRILRVQCMPSFRYSRLLRGCFLGQPSVFFRRRVLEDHKLDVRNKVAIDYEYWLRIGKNCRFHHIPRILAGDRNHGGRISVAQADKLRRVSDQLRKQYLGEPTLRLRLEWLLDILLSGVPRRIKGMILLLALRRKRDFAFNAKVVLNTRSIRNQIFPRGLEKLRP